MALRLQQIEIKRWHADVDLLVNQLASLVSNFFHRHPTSNMRQDIWPAIWENNAVENSWTIHYTFFREGWGVGLVGIAFALVCGCVGRPHVTIQTIYHSISYFGRMSLFGFLKGEGGGRFCLFASEHIVGVSDVRWWQACIEKGGGKPWQVDHDRREALNGLCTHAVQSLLLCLWWTTRRMLSATCCITHFNNKW